MKSPLHYTPKQMDQIQAFIQETFGSDENGMIAHEITSEYVHTDIHIVAPQDDRRIFVTFGMGARQMHAPRPSLCRAELLMCASKAFDPASREGMILMAELVALSKFPFRQYTWLHHGHTIEASDAFRETFGFDAFTFVFVQCADIDGIGEVDFLQVIPIYQEEREWMMQANSFEGYLLMENVFGDRLYEADSRRNAYIPDAEAIRKLQEFMERQQEYV